MKVILCCVFISLTNVSAKQIPSYINLCKKNDPNLNECYRKNFQNVLERSGPGIPDLNLRPTDPILFEQLKLDFGNGSSLAFRALLNNVHLYGLTEGKLINNDINLKTGKFKLDLTFPAFSLDANYEASGKVLLLKFDSKGSFWTNITDITVVSYWNAKPYMKKGKEHFIFENINLDVSIEHFKMFFGNLFPNNPEITENTNKVINENSDSLYGEIKPLIQEIVKTLVLDSVNSVYSLYPLDVLYPG